MDLLGAGNNAERSSTVDVLVIDGDGLETGLSWDDLDRASARVAAEMSSAGLRPGDVVVAAGAINYETVVVLFAAWRSGAAVSLVPSGSGLEPSAVAAALRRRAERLSARVGYASADVWDEGGLDRASVTWFDENAVRTAVTSLPTGFSPPSPTLFQLLRSGLPASSTGIFQATSGTTGGERIVPVSWAMLRANIDAIAEALDLDGRDSFVSWMPIYHDMGLIAYVLMPAMIGARLTVMPPELFARSPRAFLGAIERRSGSMSGCPTSGVALLERALASYDPFDLSSMRRLVCGAEMIDPRLCARTLAAGRRHRLRPDAFTFAYGMAEATLAISLLAGADPERDEDAGFATRADPGSPGRPGWFRAEGIGFARTGRPVKGMEVRVVDLHDRLPCDDRVVGEIELRGVSVMAGYHGAAPAESGIDATGWFRTGDLGYVVDGQIVIVGRLKDVIVVGGRNVAPDDVERIVGDIEGIRPGRIAAIQVAGRAGEALAVVAERSDGSSVSEREVRAALRRRLGVMPEVVRFVAKGSVLKTSSGKLRRSACRELLELDKEREVSGNVV